MMIIVVIIMIIIIATIINNGNNNYNNNNLSAINIKIKRSKIEINLINNRIPISVRSIYKTRKCFIYIPDSPSKS